MDTLEKAHRKTLIKGSYNYSQIPSISMKHLTEVGIEDNNMTFKKGEISNPNGKPKTYKIPNPYNKKFAMAKAQAKFRKEEWAFTPEEWYAFWKDSGFIEHLGKGVHQYCMVRKDPIEAWSVDNCIIVKRRTHFRKMLYENCHNVPRTDWEEKHDIRK